MKPSITRVNTSIYFSNQIHWRQRALVLLREVIFIKGVTITKQKFVIYEITKQNCYSSVCVRYSLVSADSPGKFHLLFLPLEWAIPENIRIPSGTLNVFSKKKDNSAGEKEVFLQK